MLKIFHQKRFVKPWIIVLACILFFYGITRISEHYFYAIQFLRHSQFAYNGVPKSIAVFIVVEREEDLFTEYLIAHRTMQCYCLQQGYSLELVDFSKNTTLQRICPQKDFMFRRHCAMGHFLQENPTVKWALFVDADMAIINPEHLIEEFLPIEENAEKEETTTDLVFYERIFNGEIVAGSYLARNSNATVEFLHLWADYYYKLPWSWHGTDNGAIHAVFLDKFCPSKECSTMREICWRLWRQSATDDGLRMFTDCAKMLLGKRNVFHASPLKVQLLTDFHKFWARDIWLTGSKWARRDFLLHGLKKSWQNSTKWGGWLSPFSAKGQQFTDEYLDLTKCAAGQAKWPYAPEFMAKNEKEVDEKLFERIQETRMLQLDYFRRVEEFALKEGIL